MRGAFVLLALAATSAWAGPVEVKGSPCAAVTLEADDAPLGDVLAAMSAKLAFRLDQKVPLAERVTLSRKAATEDLLKQLLKGRNLVFDTAPSKACGGSEVITRVWVLPAGEAGQVRRDDAPERFEAQPTQASETQLRPLRPERPRGTRKRMSEEQWQQMKRDYQAGKVKADPKTGLPVPADAQAADAQAEEPPAASQEQP